MESFLSFVLDTNRLFGLSIDEVTGLYYYGARYYDPRTSVWQSPDPILGEYMSGQTNGGVFNPKNLGLFTYAYNSPIVLKDPNGNWSSYGEFSQDAHMALAGAGLVPALGIVPDAVDTVMYGLEGDGVGFGLGAVALGTSAFIPVG